MKEIKNDAFVFYKSYLDQIEAMRNISPDSVNDFIQAIIEYGLYEEYETEDPIVKMAMTRIMDDIDRSHNRYELAKENGAAGGQKRGQFNAREIAERAYNNPHMSRQELANYFGCSTKTVDRAKKKYETTYGQMSKNVSTMKQKMDKKVDKNETKNGQNVDKSTKMSTVDNGQNGQTSKDMSKDKVQFQF